MDARPWCRHPGALLGPPAAGPLIPETQGKAFFMQMCSFFWTIKPLPGPGANQWPVWYPGGVGLGRTSPETPQGPREDSEAWPHGHLADMRGQACDCPMESFPEPQARSARCGCPGHSAPRAASSHLAPRRPGRESTAAARVREERRGRWCFRGSGESPRQRRRRPFY